MSRPVRPKHPPRVLKTRRLWVVLGALVAFAGIATAAYLLQAGRQAEQWRELARTSAKERNFARSVEFYDRYLSYKPADAAEVRFELAGVYDEYARGSIARPREAWALWNKSLEEYNMGLQAQPANHAERLKLAELYLLLGKNTYARREVEYLRKEPTLRDDPRLFELLAVCDDGDKEADKKLVAEHLRAAVNTGRAGSEVYLKLATLMKLDLGTPDDQKQADALMEKLLTDKKGKPDDLVAHLAYARYQDQFDRRHRAREAIEYAYKSIPGGRENVDVILAHADAVAADNLTEARNVLNAGVQIHPDNALLGMGLAEVESRTGNKDAARTQLAAVFARLPDGDPLSLEVGDRLLDLGDIDTATRAAAKLEARFPPPSDAKTKPEDMPHVNPLVAPLSGYLRGRVKLTQGDWPAALPLLRQAVLAINASRVVKRKPPMLHKAYTALGTAYGLANDPKQQADNYFLAAKQDPTSVSTRVAYADALAKFDPPAAEREYTAVVGSSPTARAALANMKLVEDLSAPAPASGPRKLDNFWTLVGKGPYPPELAPAVATAFAAQGKPDEAEKVLAAAVKEKPTPQAFALLAALKGAQGKDAAFAVLDEADKVLKGPTADVQLARAAVLAREPKPDTAAIAALATADKLSAADRGRLKPAIGELLLSLGAADKGLPLLLEAAAEQKYDLGVRMVLFDWALAKKDVDLRDKMLTQIRALDTHPDAADGVTLGGIALVAEVMHELAENPKPAREVNDRLTKKLVAAETKRKGWSRISRMRGILAAAADKPEEAVKFYDAAVRQGDRSEPLVREVVRLYFRKERYAHAKGILEFVRGKGPLSPELEQQYQVLLSVADGDPNKALARALSKEMVESSSLLDHVLRAQILARFGKEKEAKDALDAALKLSPAAPEVFVAKLRVLLMLGHSPDKLRPEIEAAAKVLRAGNPTNPAAAPLALGQMWELVGDSEAAVKEYSAAMTAAPADRDAPLLLLAAYRRGNNTAAADAMLGKLAAGTDADLRRWAKRMQAAALVAGPDALANVTRAIKLLDDNIAEADRGEDKRARAFVLCADPLQRKAGLAELKAPRGREPLSPDDAFRLAGILIEGAQFDAAEKELSDATTAGLLADPAHLVLLAQVQLLKNELTPAKNTVSRLKAIAPNRPDVMLEEARLLARSNPAKAAELVLSIPTTVPPALKSLQHAQWLEGIGCVEQAKKQYDEYFRGADPLPDRLTAVAEFFARTGHGDKALSLVKEAEGKEGVTPELAARLMVGAVRGRPVASVPPAQKAEWEKAVTEVVKYVDEKAGATPSGTWVLWQAELADGRGDQPKALTRYDAARDAFARDTTANGKFGQAVALNNRVALRTLSSGEGTADLLRQANEVISLVGPRAFALDTRGVVLFHSGKAGEALPDFEAAVAYAASPANLFHLAQCYRKLGKSEEADDAIKRAKLLGLKKTSLHPLEAKDYDAVVK